LRECPNCHNVLPSVCGKAACKIDGKCPQMIFLASYLPTKRKLALCQSSDEEESSSDCDSVGDSFEESDDPMDDEEDPLDEVTLKKIWSVISPPNVEADIVGKWFGVIYSSKKRASLFIAKINKRFLHDENGRVDKLLMTCLKPKVGLGNILEDTTKHLPPDQGMFDRDGWT